MEIPDSISVSLDRLECPAGSDEAVALSSENVECVTGEVHTYSLMCF